MTILSNSIFDATEQSRLSFIKFTKVHLIRSLHLVISEFNLFPSAFANLKTVVQFFYLYQTGWDFTQLFEIVSRIFPGVSKDLVGLVVIM